LIWVNEGNRIFLQDNNIKDQGRPTMTIRTTLTMAVALQFLAVPVMAQGISDKDANAHHYQGGPQTGVPHSTKHTKPSDANAKVRAPSGGHHYSGGPKTESHHMGEKK
jgi:hypothetical protein